MEKITCRICLKSGERSHKLDEKIRGQLIWEAINELANVFVSVGDGWPQYICKNCSGDLATAIKLKIEVEKSDEILQSNGRLTIIKTESDDYEMEKLADSEPLNVLEPTVIIKSKRGRIIKQKQRVYEEEEEEEDGVELKKVEKTKSEEENEEEEFKVEDLVEEPQPSESKPPSRKRKKKIVEFRCCMCQEVFNDDSELTTHVDMSHSEKIQANLGKKFITRQIFECKYCLLKFRTRKFLRQHFLESNFKEPPRKRTWKPKTKINQNIVCTYCGKISADIYESRVHELRVHAEDFPVSCTYPGCNKRFAAEIIMRKHYRIHKERTHICDVCGKAFATAKYLEKHVYVHKETKPLKCSYCPKTFIHNNALKTHEESHTQEKVWSCDQCERTYKWKEDLQKHVRGFHLGDHPYKCKYCNKGYFCSSSRKYHQDRCHMSDNQSLKLEIVH